MRSSAPTSRIWIISLLPAMVLCLGAAEPQLTAKQLVATLQRGGCVILMRHANSPGTPPDPTQADPGNSKHERQLDETGRVSARAMGEALRRLRLPVGDVLSSPTYRALETARLAALPAPQAVQELGDGGKSMSPGVAGTRGAWLRSQVAKAPKAGTDTILITHYPNIKDAFATDAENLGEGEALIFRPDGHGAASLVGRVKIEDWPRLVALAANPTD